VKFTIGRKLLLSYLIMAILTVVASTYALVHLHSLNSLTYAIIEEDVYIADTSRQMLENLLARESAEKRFLILKDPAIAELYWIRSREFEAMLRELRYKRTPYTTAILDRLRQQHDQYNKIFSEEMTLIQDKQENQAQDLSDQTGRLTVEAMAGQLRTLERRAQENTDRRMTLIGERGQRASNLTIALSAASLFVGLILVMLVIYNISRPLRKLEEVTGLIAEGQFDHSLDFRRQDEIGSLSRAFEIMASRLKVLEGQHLDASPLTGLPGNRAIEREIEHRLGKKQVFSLCHVDLDNFKAFADKYGYAWGSEVIKELANLLLRNRRALGAEDDFLGHIGGDDFVVIAPPERAEPICRQIAEEFNQQIGRFYTDKDRQRGFIVGKDRRGQTQKFPLITLTISMITDDGTRFHNPIEMSEAVATLKEYAKTLPGNNVVREEDVVSK
jgi:diguanylate cyclase (GGDEF)-like protein